MDQNSSRVAYSELILTFHLNTAGSFESYRICYFCPNISYIYLCISRIQEHPLPPLLWHTPGITLTLVLFSGELIVQNRISQSKHLTIEETLVRGHKLFI